MDNVHEEKTCLIIAPIGEEKSVTRKRSDSLITFIINPVVLALGYDPIRADKISEEGFVTSQIIRRLVNSPLVIADLSDGNPNVFYELAIRHMLRRPLVHLIAVGQKIPFNLGGIRVINYPALEGTGNSSVVEDVLAAVEQTKNDLDAHIRVIRNEDFKAESPITFAVNEKELSGALAPRKQLVAEVGHETDALITSNTLGLKGKWHWLHIRISNNHSDEMAKDCFGLILGTKDLGTDSAKNLSASLKWEDTNDSKLSIPTGVDKQFDAVLISHDEPNKAILGLNWYSMGFPGINLSQYTLMGPGDFELKFGVFSDNFPSKNVSCRLHLGDNLDDVKFELI